jgi:antitoxin HicB
MTKEAERGKAGSSFDDYLQEQGTYEQTTEHAVKRVLAYQLETVMKASGINKVEMAKQLKTSRSQLDRLLDPDNDNVTLAALSKAAKAVGRTLHLELQ